MTQIFDLSEFVGPFDIYTEQATTELRWKDGVLQQKFTKIFVNPTRIEYEWRAVPQAED